LFEEDAIELSKGESSSDLCSIDNEEDGDHGYLLWDRDRFHCYWTEKENDDNGMVVVLLVRWGKSVVLSTTMLRTVVAMSIRRCQGGSSLLFC
jgi:hypothetical protein